MTNELNQLAQKQKALPEHSKVVERAVLEHTVRLEAAQKSQRDARQMIMMLESEIAAQQRAMAAQCRSSPAEQPAMARLKSKLAGYVKLDKENNEEIAQCSEAIRKYTEEKNGDQELKKLMSKKLSCTKQASSRNASR